MRALRADVKKRELASMRTKLEDAEKAATGGAREVAREKRRGENNGRGAQSRRGGASGGA